MDALFSFIFACTIWLTITFGICALWIFICYRIAVSKGLPKSYMWFGLLGIIGVIIVALIEPPYNNNYPPYQNPNQQQYNQNPYSQKQRNPYQQPQQPPQPPQPKNPNAVNLNKQPQKYCRNCGATLLENSRFCDNCGCKVD